MSEQKWREVLDAVGYKEVNKFADNGELSYIMRVDCFGCDENEHPPLTLDALFEVAEKLLPFHKGYRLQFHQCCVPDSEDLDGWQCSVYCYKPERRLEVIAYESTLLIALLNALHQATEHRRK